MKTTSWNRESRQNGGRRFRTGAAFSKNIPKAARNLCVGFAILALGLGIVFPSPGWTATFRITLKDGNRVEVPFCWEKGTTLFFEIPGGVAGIPKSEVARIEEVITSDEISLDSSMQKSRLRPASPTE